jgi:hypothetical protein
VAAENNQGYPARRSEIQRFGWSARRILKVTPRKIDGRSFAAVVKMDRGWDSGSNRGRGPASRPGRGSGRFGGSQFMSNRSEQFERWESHTRGRSYGESDPEGFRGYGGIADPPRQINNKRHFDEREKLEREEQDLRPELRREQEDRCNQDDGRRAWPLDDRDSRRKTSGTHQDYHCFNCDGTGHMWKDCTNPPFCYSCKKSGHRSSVCPEKRGLRLCGFGIPGQGFYSIHIHSDRGAKAKKEVLGILVVESGEANVEIIEKELRHLFKEVPKWNIRKKNEENEYMIGFPNEDMRHQCSRFRSFEFETATIKAKVIPTDMSPEADGSLEVVWVKAYNVYPDARKEDTIMELAYLVGDPIEVDLKSLTQGPIRVKVACREARKIRGETRFFSMGRDILSDGTLEF